eukprot:scaffold168829_cov40-Prasinocladus_malaysianus.AAC.1
MRTRAPSPSKVTSIPNLVAKLDSLRFQTVTDHVNVCVGEGMQPLNKGGIPETRDVRSSSALCSVVRAVALSVISVSSCSCR